MGLIVRLEKPGGVVSCFSTVGGMNKPSQTAGGAVDVSASEL